MSAPGTENTFVGINAGSPPSPSVGNSFFGVQAGQNNGGSNNSFFGGLTGLSSTGGTNSFFGWSAGLSNLSGSSNAFFGSFSGQNNAGGARNSFFGASAGKANMSGTNNASLGANSNVGLDNLNFATAIGSEAIVGASDTIVLGKVAGTYNAVARPADTVQIPGNLNIVGTLNASGSNLTNLNATNISSGTLPPARGGTGVGASGAAGNVLRSNGTAWTSAPLNASDIPNLAASYIQNGTTPQTTTNFNISGNGTVGGILSAQVVVSDSKYFIGDDAVVSTEGSGNLFVGIGAGKEIADAGDQNSFFGRDAGTNTKEGSNNSFFGYSAGFSNDSGDDNSFFGEMRAV